MGQLQKDRIPLLNASERDSPSHDTFTDISVLGLAGLRTIDPRELAFLPTAGDRGGVINSR